MAVATSDGSTSVGTSPLGELCGRIENAAALATRLGLPGETDDTTLIEALLRQEGVPGLRGVEGAFAYVLDQPSGDMLLGRDALAMRPLYWSRHRGRVRASPRLAPMLAEVDLEPDRAAVLEWLLYRQVLPPATLYRNIRAVPQGHAGSLAPDADAPALLSFDDLDGLISAERSRELAKVSDAAIVDELDRLLVAAVERACAGRSRVAVLLSGGIDSSLVASIARRFAQVTAFTMATQGHADFDESERARSTAARLGMPIEVEPITPGGYVAGIADATCQLGLPLFHAQNVGFNVAYDKLLARVAALGIDRVLSGDNAGSLFGFASGRATALSWLLPLRSLLRRAPTALASALQKAGLDSGGVPITIAEIVTGAPPAMRMVDGGARARLIQTALRMCSFIPDERHRLIKATAFSDVVAWLPRFMDRAALLGDRHAIEVTTPFYERRLLTFGLNLPLHCLHRREGRLSWRWINKWALMRVAERHLGDLSFFRPRAAWRAPQAVFAAPLAARLLTADGFCAAHFGLSAPALEAELAAWRQDPNTLAKLAHLELWGRVCVLRQDARDLGLRLGAADAEGNALTP